MHKKSPRALAIEAQPFDPAMLTVAGDASTPHGMRYADTFANDFRNPDRMVWGETHEQLVLSLAQTAKWHATEMPDESPTVNVPDGDADGVFLISVDDGDPSSHCADDRGAFDVLVEDGRQRRRCAVVFNARLRWIAERFVQPVLAEFAAQGVDTHEYGTSITYATLGQRLINYGPDGESPAVFSDAVDVSTLPPTATCGPHNPPSLTDGDVIAPWLTRAFAEAITSPANPFFTADGDPIPLFLRLDVRGEDVDLNDPRILLHNILRKESVVPTPRQVKAEQYRKLLALRKADGSPVYTPYSLAQSLGVAPGIVLHVVDYLAISPTIRSAVDVNTVSLTLCVTGRESICYGYDAAGKRHLLSDEQQNKIFTRLLEAFRVEAGEDGIRDNAMTRAVLRKIKGEELEGTDYAQSADRKVREARSVAAARAAAERVGAELPAETVRGLSRVAAEEDEAAEREDSDYSASEGDSTEKAPRSDDKTSPSRPVTVAERHVAEASKAPSVPSARVLRDQVRERAAAVRADIDGTWARHDDGAETALSLAAAFAVLSYLDGDSTALLRFPVLAEALRGRVVETVEKPAAPKPVATKAARRKVDMSSPFAREDLAKEVVAEAVTICEAAKPSGCDHVDAADIARYLNEAAESRNADAECLLIAATKLENVLADYTAGGRRRLHDDPAVHVREALYS